MKNKRLVTILGLLAVLAIGGIVYSSLNSKGNTTKTSGDSQTVKVGVLQYVSHPSLDLIYKGIARMVWLRKAIRATRLRLTL